jgi:hypothetical protein
MIHWLAYVLGLTNASGGWYLWHSGFGSGLDPNIGMLAIFGLLWHRLRCHTDGCRKIGTHHVPGTHWTTCRKHHPLENGRKPTAEEIAVAFQKANGGKHE